MRILLSRMGLLGDTLGAYSVMPILKKQFGDNIECDWMVRSGLESLFQHDPSVKNIYPLKSRYFLYQLFFYLKTHFKPYDLIINLDTGRCLSVLKWIPAKQKYGFPFQNIIVPPMMHLFSSHQYLCRALLNISDDEPVLPQLFGSTIIKIKPAKPYIILVPATSRTSRRKKHYLRNRNWPLSHWNDFLKYAEKLPFQCVIVGTKADKKIIEAELIIPAHVINYLGKTSIPELITLIQEASAVVTCDTGILHIASAVKTPIFALLGPSNEILHGPFPVNNTIHTIIRSQVACSPCERTALQKTCVNNVCMQHITPERVYTIIETRLLPTLHPKYTHLN